MSAPPRLSAALEGRYAIERVLGEGGMATVYLARDLKHERHVALKVLKPELSAVVGAERFLAEIRTTANLQHPNILPLYDSGEADSFLYYVMPHVEGDTLRDRLDREKQLSVDEAVKIATAVANALDFAHEHGVVHRDIKPGNILFQAGQPVVGDFGIALAVGAGGGARLTETGLSVGTPYYMSPEQATGDQNVGPRSDVYSLGCVLYEMLTGDPPYTGSTAQAVLGQIIAGRPVATTERRDSVPQHVDAAVRCALEKVPADRFARARDFAAALANPGFRHGEAGVTAGVVALRRWKAATAVGGLMAVAALAWGVRPRTSEIAARIVRFTVSHAETTDTASFLAGRVASTRDKVNELSLSPDGSLLAYAAFDGQKWSLFVYNLERAETERWAAGDTVRSPFFSPDGEWIGVITPDALKRINVATRQVETLATGTGSGSLRGSAAWGDDGTILVATDDGVYRVPAGGGGFEKIPVPAGTLYASPQLLPGSRTALFAVNPGVDPKKGSVVAMDLKTGDETVLVEAAAAPRYSPTGHLLFLREGTLLGMAFDARRLAVTGEPVVMAQGVMQAYYMDNSGQETGTGQISLSASGDLAYATGGVTPEASLLPTLFDRSGLVRTLDVGARGYAFFRYSPDGSQLAYHAGPGQNNAIGIITLATGVTRKLSLGGFTVQQPTWSPDGKWLAFQSDSSGTPELYRVPTDGTGKAERLLPPGTEGWPYSWSKQGVLAYGNEKEIWVLPPDGKPARFVETPYYAIDASFSPGGEWLAYIAPTGENGPTEVFVRPYPGPGAAVQVSDGGGYNPGWSRGGDTLYFGSDRHLMAVGVTTRGAEFRAGRPAVFISEWPYRRIPLRGYDVAPDGRILQYYSPPQKGVPERLFQQVHFVLGFGGELKRRIPN